MDHDEQTDALRFDIDNLCDRYLNEFDINVFTTIGALTEKRLEYSKIIDMIEDKIRDLVGDDIQFDVDDDFFKEE